MVQAIAPGQILRVKSSDGTSAGPNLDVSGVTTGTLSGLAVQKDGTIWACNSVASTTTPLRIYKWANEDAVAEVAATLTNAVNTQIYGRQLSVFVREGISTNFIVSGSADFAYFLLHEGTNWTFKQINLPLFAPTQSQALSSGGTFLDYDAPGFPNQFRIIGKGRGNAGYVYRFNPTASSPIVPVSTAMGGPWVFAGNGITTHDYDPSNGMLVGVTSTLQTGGFDYTNMIFSTRGTASLAPPVELARIQYNALTADGGTQGGTVWGPDGRFYATMPAADVGLQAFDVSAFLIAAPTVVSKSAGQTATLETTFGGSALIYAWTKDSVSISNDSKYSGATTASLSVANLIAADAGTYVVTATDANGGTATASITLTVSPAKVWTGGGSTFSWTDAGNWGGTALGTSGETAVFAGINKLISVMDGSYDVLGLSFANSAGAFTITNAPGVGVLTLSGTLANDSANLQSIGVPLALNGDQTADISGPVAITGELSGTSALTKAGAGTLTLAGTNTHNGPVTVSAGTLALASGAAISDEAAVTLKDGATLTVSAPETIGPLTGSFASSILADGLTFGGSANSAHAGSIVLNSRGLTVAGSGNVTLNGNITGAGDLQVAGTGTVTLNVPTAYTGRTILTSGTLSINDATTLGTNVLQFNGGTLFRSSQTTPQVFAMPVSVTADSTLAGNPASGTRSVIFSTPTLTSTGGKLTITNSATSGTGLFQVRLTGTSANSSVPMELGQGDFGTTELLLTNNATGTQVISGNISGNGRVLKNGAAVARQTTLSGSNSFSGGFTILGGRVNLNNNNALGTGIFSIGANPLIEIGSGVAGIVINNNVELASGAAPIIYGNSGSHSLELAGVISGDGRLVRTNTGTGTVILSGDNTFNGGVTIYSRGLTLKHRNAIGTGTLTLGDPAEAAISTAVSVTSGADLTGANAIANAVIVNTNFTVSAGATTPIEFTSDLQQGIGGKGMTKTGAGVLTLSGFNNSYSGPTTVSAGTLNVNGALTASPVTVGANGTLSGNGTVNNAVTVNGTVSGGSIVGTLSTADQTWNGGSHYRWDMNDATGSQGSNPGWDFININGALTITATSASKFTIDVTSFAGSVLGDAANFNGGNSSQSWKILTATGGITGFTPSAFNVTMTGFSNPSSGAKFAVRQNGSDLELYLTYPPQNFTITGAGTATFTGAANTGYLLEFTDTLNPINWQPLTTVGNSGVITTDGSGVGSYADPGPLPPTRFYRLSLQ